MLRWITVALIGLAAMAGCGGQETGGTPTMPTTPPDALTGPVTITRTGGIAGVHQSIEIALDGSWVYTDRRQNRTERGTLTQAQRAQLLALVATPGFAEQLLVSAPPPTCADGFHYEISVGARRGAFDDCGDASSPALRAVIEVIGESTPL